MYYTLFVLDLFWSAGAWIVDYGKLFSIPVWAWPFCLVCPVYPLLLAIIWYRKARNVVANEWLMAFAILPSVVLGPMAIAYYPLKMINSGFNILDLGQIFWVLFYSVQAWSMINEKIRNKTAVVCATFFLIAKFTIDFLYLSFDYLDLGSLQDSQLLDLYLLGLGLSLLLGVYKLKKV